jgi:hypothetical protein
MNFEPGKTYVRKLSAVTRERDALALRLRLERALAQADFHPPGLHASAILCVRRLSDRSMQATRTRARGSLAFADWQRRVAETVERLARHAASPARGVVPADAEAVIFGDRAELLACLAADWCEGYAPARWWWRSLFGGLDAAAAMLPAWLASPEQVPAALERLSAGGKLIAFARALGETDARSIRTRLVHAFGLYGIASALDSAGAREERSTLARDEAGETLPGERSAGEGGDAGEGAGANAGQRRPRAEPWARYVPELRGHGLGREQGCMAGVGLMLLRAPSQVRSYAFAETVKLWRLDSGARASAPPDVEAYSGREVKTAETPAVFDGGRETSAQQESVVESSDGGGESRALPATRDEATPRPRVEHEGDADETSSARALFVAEGVQSSEAGGRDGSASIEAETRAALREPTLEKEATGTQARAGETNVNDYAEADEFVPPPFVRQARIETKFGGLFYLINLGLFLNLYGDFTTPLTPGLALPLWDFLALLGERLCGARVREDAVWGLLARLAGRHEDEPPGGDFAPDDAWRLPPEWLKPFEETAVLSWSGGGGRLRARHPEGFQVLDVPLARAGRHVEDEARLLDEELAVYDARARFTLRRAPPVVVGDDDEGEGGALERWLDRLLAYVGARLRLALGAGGADEAARLVCEQRARVVVTETRLDVTFALEQLPFEVRLSGLDRDPGWVPAAGRHVAFRYE